MSAWSRFIDLEGGFNFRDLGGYSTADGRRVRHGLIYRSGVLSRLTTVDLALLSRLGVAQVFDLRTTAERLHHPTRFGGETWSRDYDASGGDIVRALTSSTLSADQCATLMIETYRALPEEQADSLAELFRRSAAGALPLVFHCAAGKDRTGIAAALLLDLLGVPRATIVEDYLHTRRVTERLMAEICASLRQIGVEAVDPAAIEPLIAVDPAYLEAMFEVVEDDYGSTERYVHSRLAITPAQTEAIRGNLLEPAPAEACEAAVPQRAKP